MTNRMELAALAHRRYPDMPINLAVDCLQHDRQRSGLGALDERRRRGDLVSNAKRMEPSRGVVYVLSLYRPPSRRYVPGTFTSNTVQVEQLPERRAAYLVVAQPREFHDQHSRRQVALRLLRARRELRRSLEESAAVRR